MNTSDYDTKYIKALDGIRALAIVIIVWFHFWQQSWLEPSNNLAFLGFLPKYGFLFVDLLILLSGFCLFIPYARSKFYKEKIPKTRDFYVRRVARIFPSYYLSMIISILFLILLNNDWYNIFFIKDTIMHIFFVHNWSIDTIISSNYFGVLWTVAVEVQLYLIFPFIAKKFIKKPVLTYSIMMIIGIISLYFMRINLNIINDPLYINHFLTFIPVFANGMLAAYLYISYTKNKKRKKLSDIIFTIISILAIIGYYFLCRSIDGNDLHEWQLDNRLIMSFIFMIFILSTILASKVYQKIYTNKVMKFIALISYNLYIYHQFIAIKLIDFRIPYYSGDELPNEIGNKTWQWEYMIICVIVSVIVAIIMTYLVEKPLAKIIKKKFKIC